MPKIVRKLLWWLIPNKGCSCFCPSCQHFDQCVWECYVDICDENVIENEINKLEEEKRNGSCD